MTLGPFVMMRASLFRTNVSYFDRSLGEDRFVGLRAWSVFNPSVHEKAWYVTSALPGFNSAWSDLFVYDHEEGDE